MVEAEPPPYVLQMFLVIYAQTSCSRVLAILILASRVAHGRCHLVNQLRHNFSTTPPISVVDLKRMFDSTPTTVPR